MPALVQEVGGIAGWATVVGLAVLAALYVSQARDVKRLREWATRAPERPGRGVSAVPARAAAASPRPSRPRYSWIGGRHVALALVGLLAFGGAAAYGVTQLTGGDGGDTSRDAQAKKPKRKPAVVNPGTVTVAVLNGTTVPGLAAAMRDQIAAAGFKKGMINVFSDQQLAASVVQYSPGHEAAAEAVGRTFEISRREPVTAESRALAGDATVIVIAGADKAP